MKQIYSSYRLNDMVLFYLLDSETQLWDLPCFPKSWSHIGRLRRVFHYQVGIGVGTATLNPFSSVGMKTSNSFHYRVNC